MPDRRLEAAEAALLELLPALVRDANRLPYHCVGKAEYRHGRTYWVWAHLSDEQREAISTWMAQRDRDEGQCASS